jgi:hypothetical protein
MKKSTIKSIDNIIDIAFDLMVRVFILILIGDLLDYRY